MLGIKGKGKETRNIIKRLLPSPTDSCEKDMQESSFIFLSFKKLLFSRSFSATVCCGYEINPPWVGWAKMGTVFPHAKTRSLPYVLKTWQAGGKGVLRAIAKSGGGGRNVVLEMPGERVERRLGHIRLFLFLFPHPVFVTH